MATMPTTIALSVSPSSDIMPILEQMEGMMYLGDTLVKSGLLPSSVKSKETAVAIMLKARELGIGPMEAFSSINIIQGKPTISPQLMIALAERSGALADYRIDDDGKCCTCTVIRRGRSPFSASFSMDDAAKMELQSKGNWKSQPRVMRQWRAVSAAFRLVFADVLAGIYIPDEVGAETDTEGNLVAAPSVLSAPRPIPVPVLTAPVDVPVDEPPVSDADIDALIADTIQPDPDGVEAPMVTTGPVAVEAPENDNWRSRALNIIPSAVSRIMGKPGGTEIVLAVFEGRGKKLDTVRVADTDYLRGVIAGIKNKDVAAAIYNDLAVHMS